MLLSNKKHTDTLIEQTKTKPQETREIVLYEQMKTFSFSPPINLSEKGNCLVAVTSFECTNSVFNITNENNSFSITIEVHWSSRGGAETINKLQKLIQFRPKNDIKLHVEEVKERANQIKIVDRDYKLSDLDTREEETNGELKNAEYSDLEAKVFMMELTYHEVAETLDTKSNDAKSLGYTFPAGNCEFFDINLMLKSLLPDHVKVHVVINHIRLRSNLTSL